MKYCGRCDKSYLENQEFCEECGNRLIEAPILENETLRICLACGTSLDVNELFCSHCGAKNDIPEEVISESETIIEEVNDEAVAVSKIRCPNCGIFLSQDSEFCTSCGFSFKVQAAPVIAEEPISQRTSENESPRPAEEPNSETTKKKRRPKKKGTIWLKVLLVATALLLATGGGLYLYGKNRYSQERQINDFIEILERGKGSELSKAMKSEDSKFKLSEKNIQPFVSYLKEDGKYLSSLETELRSGRLRNTKQDIYLSKKGKYLFIFDRYEFVLNPVYTEIQTNKENATITLNEEEIAVSNSENYTRKIGPLSPGKYVFSVKAKEEDDDFEKHTELNLVRNGKDVDWEEINLAIHTLSFEVRSNIADAEVFIDGEKIGDLAGGKLAVGPLIWQRDMTVQVKKTYGSSVIESDVKTIDEDFSEDELYFDFESDMSKEGVGNFFDIFYSTVQSGINSSYESMNRTNLATCFVDGTTNAEFLDFDTYILSTRKNKKIDSQELSPEVESISRVDKDLYQVVYKITYTTIYSYASDENDRIETFRYKKATVKFEANEKYPIKIVDLGGADNFEKLFDSEAN